MFFSKENRARALYAAQKLAALISLSSLAQVLQLIGALVVVRTLSKEEYGIYSLANTLLGALALFTMTGMSTGLMAVAGPVAENKEKLGAVMSAAVQLRRHLLAVGTLVGVPVYYFLLLKNGCTPFVAAALLAITVISVLFYIRAYVLAVALNLTGSYSIVQKEKVANALTRLVILGGLLVLALQGTLSYMIAGLTATMVALFYYLAPASRGVLEGGVSPDPKAATSLRKHMVVGMPSCLTYLFEGQIAALLLALFANVDKVADLGAIARFGLIFIVPFTLLTDLLIPRMARLAHLTNLRRIWVFTSSLTAAVCVVALCCFWLFANTILALLGPDYGHLREEMLLFLAIRTLAFFFNVVASPVNARGWVKHSWIRPIVVILAQIAVMPVLDLTTVSGAILLSGAGSLGNAALDMFLLYNGWRGRGSLK